jgi:hypothetical protein
MATKKNKKALAALIEGLSLASREAIKSARTRAPHRGAKNDLSGIKPDGAADCGGCK